MASNESGGAVTRGKSAIATVFVRVVNPRRRSSENERGWAATGGYCAIWRSQALALDSASLAARHSSLICLFSGPSCARIRHRRVAGASSACRTTGARSEKAPAGFIGGRAWSTEISTKPPTQLPLGPRTIFGPLFHLSFPRDAFLIFLHHAASHSPMGPPPRLSL